jgi:hypothetical protein
MECPTWYLPSESDPGSCVCGNTLNGKVRCLQDEQVSVVVGNCMSYDEELGEPVVGLCPYSVHDASQSNFLYTTMPKNVSKLNEFMCGGKNRTGLFCSKCEEGLTLAAMSYLGECVVCDSISKGVILFFVMAFIPTTIFFLLLMVCTINISSGPMNAALALVQVNLAQVNQSPMDYLRKSSDPLSYYLVLVLLTFYGIWNLDFLRYVMPPFCVSNSLTTVQTQALEYVIAVYPLLLIALTYIAVELYDNQYRVVVALWTPFKKVFGVKLFKHLNVKTSLITTFASFLQLVYARIFFISKEILNYSEIQDNTGHSERTVLANDPSVPYLSAQHIPYMLLAISMLLAFNLLPLLLLVLYPTKCFQNFLGCFPRVNWHPLLAFMDIFQGCYKNGTNATRDCRYFAAFNFLFRIFMLAPVDVHSISSLKLVLVPLIFSFLLAILRPYCRNILNYWGIFCYFMCTLNQLWIMCSTYDTHLSLNIAYISHFVLFLYFCLLIAGKTWKTVFPQCYSSFVEKVKRGPGKLGYFMSSAKRNDLERGPLCEGDDEFPDRFNNPQEYEPLLAHSRFSHASAPPITVASYGI